MRPIPDLAGLAILAAASVPAAAEDCAALADPGTKVAVHYDAVTTTAGGINASRRTSVVTRKPEGGHQLDASGDKGPTTRLVFAADLMPVLAETGATKVTTVYEPVAEGWFHPTSGVTLRFTLTRGEVTTRGQTAVRIGAASEMTVSGCTLPVYDITTETTNDLSKPGDVVISHAQYSPLLHLSLYSTIKIMVAGKGPGPFIATTLAAVSVEPVK